MTHGKGEHRANLPQVQVHLLREVVLGHLLLMVLHPLPVVQLGLLPLPVRLLLVLLLLAQPGLLLPVLLLRVVLLKNEQKKISGLDLSQINFFMFFSFLFDLKSIYLFK